MKKVLDLLFFHKVLDHAVDENSSHFSRMIRTTPIAPIISHIVGSVIVLLDILHANVFLLSN